MVIPAGFWRRWCARFVDQVILAAIALVILLLVFRLEPALYPGQAARRMAVAGYLLVAALYFAATESSRSQASVGKRLFGIKVVDSSGNRISFLRALGRWWAAGLSWLSLGIGFLLAGTGSKRALHDFASGTQVVDRWALSPFPERQDEASFGQVAFGFATVLLVLLALLVRTQYSDYLLRAQVSEGLSLADSVKTAMEAHVTRHGGWPTSNAQIEPGNLVGEYVSRVDIEKRPGRIEITYSSRPPHHSSRQLEGRHLYIDGRIDDGKVRWICHSGELRQADCPRRCRCTW
jgi:uncharacterized RDD family membrane protein YckC